MKKDPTDEVSDLLANLFLGEDDSLSSSSPNATEPIQPERKLKNPVAEDRANFRSFVQNSPKNCGINYPDLEPFCKKELKEQGFNKENILKFANGVIFTNAMAGMFKMVEGYEELLNICKNEPETYEFVSGTLPVKGYIDLDFTKLNSEIKNESDFKNYLDRVVVHLQNLLTPHYTLQFFLKTANKPEKMRFSAHMIFEIYEGSKCLVFENAMILKEF